MSRQAAFLGEAGQDKLRESSVVIVGCGATGSVAASLLARAGIGKLRVIDRDFVEESNLRSSALFTQNDVGKPKALAARGKLVCDAVTDDLNSRSMDLLRGFDVVLDCTDNMETRYLINEFCVREKMPWIYGGVVGSRGFSASFNGTPCFRCLFPKQPGPGSLETCETAGLLPQTAEMIGSWEAMEAVKILTGFARPGFGKLLSFDLEKPSFEFLKFRKVNGCPVCVRKDFELLGRKGTLVTSLCGRGVYHIYPARKGSVNVRKLAKELSGYETKLVGSELLHLKRGKLGVSIFNDARAIIRGVGSAREAKSLYTRILGG